MQEVQAQAAEIRKEQKEINFLTGIISAPADDRASFVARAGAALASVGYTGSHSEKQRLQAEQRRLNAEWKRLDEHRAAREARERQEYAELASVSKRLRDLEEREVEDRKRAPASLRDHREHADMLRTKANSLGTARSDEAVSSDGRQRGRGARSGQGDGEESRQKLDYRPPPYPTPPGHGRPGPARGSTGGEQDARRRGENRDYLPETELEGEGRLPGERAALEREGVWEGERKNEDSGRRDYVGSIAGGGFLRSVREGEREGVREGEREGERTWHGEGNRAKLDYRPPPYPTPPGHGRPGPARGGSGEEGREGGVQRNLEDLRLYYNRGEELREARRNDRHAEERYERYRPPPLLSLDIQGCVCGRRGHCAHFVVSACHGRTDTHTHTLNHAQTHTQVGKL